jgi:hypothetical protein
MVLKSSYVRLLVRQQAKQGLQLLNLSLITTADGGKILTSAAHALLQN